MAGGRVALTGRRGRLGDLADVAVRIPSANGQRVQLQTVDRKWLLIWSPTSRPHASVTKAMAARTPVVKASMKARPYFSTVGRSCSTP